MDAVSDDTLVAWCDRDPEARYPFAAAIATLHDQQNNEKPHGWRDTARTLLSKAPDKKTVFEEIASQMFVTDGRGSLSSQYESRLKLLNQLDLSDMPMLAAPLAKAKEALQREVDDWRNARPIGTVGEAAVSSEGKLSYVWMARARFAQSTSETELLDCAQRRIS